LWTLGLDQVRDDELFKEVHAALTFIATRARAQARRELAATALDALASVTTSRICFSQPRIGFTIPLRPLVPPPPPALESDPENPTIRYFESPPPPSSLPPLPESARPVPLPTAYLRRARLEEFAELFAETNNPAAPRADRLVTMLQEGLPEGTRPVTDPEYSQHVTYGFLCDTVETMIGLLPSPLPSSVGWPSGWMGTEAFDRDVTRLADLVEQVYLESREVPSDVVEVALERIGVRLLDEQVIETALPGQRTMWRDLPIQGEEGGIATSTAQSLSRLMAAAYEAGFDRRSLSTGHRLVALATVSAERGDASAVAAYANALETFSRRQILHAREASSCSGRVRAEALLRGLTLEYDQLLAAAYEQKKPNPALYELVHTITQTLTWRAPDESASDVAVAMLRARVMGAGWPIDGAAAEILEFEAPRTSGLPFRPLPTPALDEIRSDFPWRTMVHDRLALADVLVLWAHAVVAFDAGDESQADDIADLLRTRIGKGSRGGRRAVAAAESAVATDSDTPEAISQLRRVASAAIDWCETQATAAELVIPSCPEPHTVQAAAKALLDQAELADWTYEGTRNDRGPDLITVTGTDGSRRPLRDANLRADEFSWGYGGTGPHWLADTLVPDLLGKAIVCPDCLGAIQLTADVLTCKRCENTGLRAGVLTCSAALVSRWVVPLPKSFRASRRELLTILAEAAQDSAAPAI
jgi:hypothetical protein